MGLGRVEGGREAQDITRREDEDEKGQGYPRSIVLICNHCLVSRIISVFFFQ